MKIDKAPEFLLAGEILQLFEHDCLVASKTKYTPYPLVEQLLSAYASFLGVRSPSSKQLGHFLTNRYPKTLQGTVTMYQVAVNPNIIERETNNE